jgi:ABC-2 type transport system ATP-binding protein
MIASFEGAAKWYGQVIGLMDATVQIGHGVTGLLGPNGAGKSTFLKLLTGQLRPSQGRVRLLGVDPFAATSVHRRIGFLPEPDAFYDDLDGLAFVTLLTRLHGFGAREARARAERALERVGLLDVARRRVRGYSKGMRQRVKLAQAIAHDPDVLILDEPLTGMDPVWRRKIMELVRSLGAAGTSVIVSSHILHEVEGMAAEFILLYGGRVKAYGVREEIRAVLHQYPHRVRIRATDAGAVGRPRFGVVGIVCVRDNRGSVQVD